MRWYDNESVEAAIETARVSDRALLVDFWSPTCSGCAKLFAATYPDPGLRALLRESFVRIKYDATKPNEWFRKLNGPAALLWTPTIRVIDHRFTETRRFTGYLAPPEFMAQIELGRAGIEIHHGRSEQALPILRAVVERWPATFAAPEALYWAGVTAFRAGGGLAALTDVWARIGIEYPESDWAQRADCLDVRIPETGFQLSDPNSVVMMVAR